MPVVDGREYRVFSAESFSAEEDGGEYHVRGYATTFGQPYPFGPEGWKEQVSPEALVGADMSDVIFQYDHCGLVMARQRNSTLVLTVDQHGLLIDAFLSGSRKGRDLYEAIKNGLVDRMSVGFIVAKGGWEIDDERKISTITRISKVFDVSAVSLPANGFTEISARSSYLDGAIEERQQELLARAEERNERAKMLALLELTKGWQWNTNR